jgi:hypothetical protein
MKLFGYSMREILLLKLFKLGDFLIFFIFISIIILALNYYFHLPKGDSVEISHGNEIKHYSLFQNKTLIFDEIEVEINMGKARIKKSNCSNQYCIMQGWISKINHSVVCIPNLFKISIKSKMLSYDSTNY